MWSNKDIISYNCGGWMLVQDLHKEQAKEECLQSYGRRDLAGQRLKAV